MKAKYNYFVGLKLNGAALFDATDTVKNEILRRNPSLSKILIPNSKLHFTLNLIEIEDHNLESAKQCLIDCQDIWRAKLESLNNQRILFAGLSKFGPKGGNVLWLDPARGPQYDVVVAMATEIHSRFNSAGFNCSPASIIHGTIAKNFQKKIKILPEDYAGLSDVVASPTVYSELSRIDLLKIGSTDARTGYYSSLATITPDRYTDDTTAILEQGDEAASHDISQGAS